MMSFFDEFATVADVINLQSSGGSEQHGLLKVPEDASFEALAGYLTDHHIGIAFIHNQSDQIIGLISERDIVRQITLNGRKAFDMPITSIITHEIMHCELGDKLKTVSARMADKHLRHIAVMGDSGKYIGVISSSDIELFAGNG